MQNVRLPLDFETPTTKSQKRHTPKKKRNKGLRRDPKRTQKFGIQKWSKHPQHQTTPKQHQETHLKKPTLSSKESRWQACLQRWIACSVIPMCCPLNSGSTSKPPKMCVDLSIDQNGSICNGTLVQSSPKGFEDGLMSCTPLQHINIFIEIP